MARIEFKIAYILLLKNFKIVPEDNFEYHFKMEVLNILKNDNIVKFVPL